MKTVEAAIETYRANERTLPAALVFTAAPDSDDGPRA